MMDAERLAEIEARNAARTPGEWTCRHPICRYTVTLEGYHTPSPSVVTASTGNNPAHCYGDNFADGTFIAACSVDVPDLLAEVKLLTAENATLRTRLDTIEARAEREDSLWELTNDD